MGKTTTTYLDVGDRVRVKAGKEHDTMTRGKVGVVQQISSPALGVKFEGMPMHKWYTDDEVEYVGS